MVWKASAMEKTHKIGADGLYNPFLLNTVTRNITHGKDFFKNLLKILKIY